MNNIFNQILKYLKIDDNSKSMENIDNHLANQVLSSEEINPNQVPSEQTDELQILSYASKLASEPVFPKKIYRRPPLSLLKDNINKSNSEEEYLQQTADIVLSTFKQHDIKVDISSITSGPRSVLCVLEIDQGMPIIRINNLKGDLQLALSVMKLEIEAPIPGTSSIGISFPNKYPKQTTLKNVISSNAKDSSLIFNVGQDYIGNTISLDFNKEPYLLIAGTTGSGKSEFIDTLIMNIIMKESPANAKIILIDTHYIQFSFYNGIPHLLMPVVSDNKKAAGTLHWLYKEALDRIALLQACEKRNIDSYNEMIENNSAPDVIPEYKAVKMCHIFCVIDDYADLVYGISNEVITDSIYSLSKIGNIVGIHLIISTQRPVANIINTAIKILFPSRISFKVATSLESRLIIDSNGAEKLTTHGDFIYNSQSSTKLITGQTAVVSEDEIHAVVDYLKDNKEIFDFSSQVESQIRNSKDIYANNSPDPLLKEAGLFVLNNQKASIGLLQRNFRIGFNRAAHIMEQLHEVGVVGSEMGTKPREILMDKDDFLKLFEP